MQQYGVQFGIIQEVFPPSHKENIGKYQYEYTVDVKASQHSTVPSRCVRIDPSGGGLFSYDDIVLTVGSTVFIAFPGGNTTVGIILGGSRKASTPQEETGKHNYKNRFNQINQIITDAGDYMLQHSSTAVSKGPNINLNRDKIKIDDGGVAGTGAASQMVEFDRLGNTITVKAGTLNINVLKGATINVTGGDVTIDCINATVTAKKDVSVSGLNINLESKVKALLDAKLEASIKAQIIKLNGDGVPGQVITTLTQPTCYVTGIPFIGSKTVLAGS
jgi:hypothetical protein